METKNGTGTPGLGVSLEYIKRRPGEEARTVREAAELCGGAGFFLVDYTSDVRREDWRENAEREREILDACGIRVAQTHAPFNRYRSFPDETFWECFGRSFEISKILGAKYVVVHADEYRVKDRYDEKEILEFTYGYLAPFVEYAAKNGMTVAVENVFEDHNYRWGEIDGKSRFTSRVSELRAIIERFGDPAVGCCWDFGHAQVAFGKDGAAGAMKQVGEYIVCTHVHDNIFGKDLHLVPFLGECDWEKELCALADCGYSGDLSFEFAYGALPDGLVRSWLDYLKATGDRLAETFCRARNGKNV